jgi:hypothetical protein
MTNIFRNRADVKSDDVGNINTTESSVTTSSATSTPSTKLLTHDEEATFETIETQTASTESQNDTNLHMSLHLEGKGGSGSISLVPHTNLTYLQ